MHIFSTNVPVISGKVANTLPLVVALLTTPLVIGHVSDTTSLVVALPTTSNCSMVTPILFSLVLSYLADATVINCNTNTSVDTGATVVDGDTVDFRLSSHI